MAIIPCNQLSLADVFQNVRIFMNLTNLRSYLFNQTLILMKLFLIPSGIISMHQRRSRKYPLHAFLWALIIQADFFNSH